MCPSDMALTPLPAHISGYNNEILVATKDMAPGKNNDLNAEKLPPMQIIDTDRPSITGSTVSHVPLEPLKPVVTQQTQDAEPRDHEDTKTLLTIAAIGAGIVYYLAR